MSIDWSKAPKGYDFYIVDKDCCEPPAFHKKVGKKYIDEDGRFWRIGSDSIKVYERPTKPAAPEWDGKGLPPVGCECEISFMETNLTSMYWVPAMVVAHDGDVVVFRDGKQYYGFSQPSRFRPIRTVEQIQKEVLASLCDEYIKRDDYGHNLADAILSRYNLEPKND